MKKLLILNAVLFVFSITSFILGYYLYQYPEDFNFFEVSRNAEWGGFGLVFLIIIIVSILLASIPIRRAVFKEKALIPIATIQLMLISFLLFKSLQNYWENKTIFKHLLSKYKNKAEKDLEAGLIEIEYVGGLQLPSKKEGMVDSITKSYGVIYRNSGCVIHSALTKAQDEYVRLTKPFLDWRNGVGWEVKMKNQIAELRNNCR